MIISLWNQFHLMNHSSAYRRHNTPNNGDFRNISEACRITIQLTPPDNPHENLYECYAGPGWSQFLGIPLSKLNRLRASPYSPWGAVFQISNWGSENSRSSHRLQFDQHQDSPQWPRDWESYNSAFLSDSLPGTRWHGQSVGLWKLGKLRTVRLFTFTRLLTEGLFLAHSRRQTLKADYTFLF